MSGPEGPSLAERGYAEGYRVGPDGIDPDGKPAVYDHPELLGDDVYRAAASRGRAQRIEDQLAAGTHHIQTLNAGGDVTGVGR